MSDALYRTNGEYVAFRDDDGIWDRNGQFVGFIDEDAVFKANGQFIGMLHEGKYVVSKGGIRSVRAPRIRSPRVPRVRINSIGTAIAYPDVIGKLLT